MNSRLSLILVGVALLNGCYFVNQPRFEASVHRQVTVGMPLQSAVAALSQLKLHCDGHDPLDCSRLRQSLLPYSCVERVRLYLSTVDPVITEIQIPKIACAGL